MVSLLSRTMVDYCEVIQVMKVKVVEQVEVESKSGAQQVQLPLLIVEGEQKPALFGHDWLSAIQLDWAVLHQVRSNTPGVVSKFPDVFQQDVSGVTIRLQENSRPIFLKAAPCHMLCNQIKKQSLNECKKKAL